MSVFKELNKTYKLQKQFANKTAGLFNPKYRELVNTIGDKYESLYMDILLMSTYLNDKQIESFLENCTEYVRAIVLLYRRDIS